MISKFASVSVTLVISITTAFAQLIDAPSGPYTSSDGRYTANFTFVDGNLTVVEPNRTTVYTPTGSNVYEYTNPANGKKYKIQVEDQRTLVAFGSTGQTNFYFTGNAAVNSKEHFKFYQNIAEQYKQKMTTDSKDAQLWSFCAAAAFQRATLNDQGFEKFAKATVDSLRTILTDQSKCPCPDAIPPTFWNTNR